MRLCVVSHKDCWQDDAGVWRSQGGFPFQMGAIGSLFDSMTIVIVRGEARLGGIPLPRHATVVGLREPTGADWRRKLSVVAHLPYYLRAIGHHIRKADVVHVAPPGDIPFLGLLAAIALRKRLVARYCGSWTVTSQTTLMNRVTRQCMRQFAGGRNLMLATGAGAGAPARGMNWIMATAVSEREVATVQPDLRRAPNEPMRLAYVGRLTSVKGVGNIISALGSLRRDPLLVGRVPRLTIVGDGSLRPELAALAKREGCEENVRFTGHLDRAEVLEHLLQSDVCVLPSLSESFCKARLDALLCGVPVITTAVGFGREIVGADGERGWLVVPGDVGALAVTLRSVLTRPIDWRALRERCRAYVKERTLEAWAREIGEQCARQWHVGFGNGRLVS